MKSRRLINSDSAVPAAKESDDCISIARLPRLDHLSDEMACSSAGSRMLLDLAGLGNGG